MVKALAAREQQARRRNLTKYIPNAAQAIFTVSAASDVRRLRRQHLSTQGPWPTSNPLAAMFLHDGTVYCVRCCKRWQSSRRGDQRDVDLKRSMWTS